MNKTNTVLNEIIGLETTIFDSKNKQLIGLYGKIIFETKYIINPFFGEYNGNWKYVIYN